MTNRARRCRLARVVVGMARVDGLPPRLAERLEREPKLGELGGQDRDVSVLFADLEGFTAYAAEREPSEVIAMLNEYRGSPCPSSSRSTAE